MLKRFFNNLDRKQVVAWALYDFANSSYALIVISFVFPIFYKEVIAGDKLGDFYWGLITSTSILLGGLAAPIVGAIADAHQRKKTKFIVLTLTTVMGTALLYFTGSESLLWASLVFIISNLGFEVALTLYDSFLPTISTKDSIGRVSGFAWGLGYIGGVAALILFQPLYGPGFEANGNLYKLTFPLTALFFLLFSLPAFVFLKESPGTSPALGFQLVKDAFKRVFSTLRSIRQYKNIFWFLIGMYLFTEGTVTLFIFMPLFAKTTLAMSINEIGLLLLVVQLVAFPATALLGWISDRKGAKIVLLSTVLGWALVTIIFYFAYAKVWFYVGTLIGALVMGSSQSSARVWLSNMIPEDKRSEFFGFNGFASKIAATSGPLIFGVISSFTGSQRYGVLAMLPFFLFAFIIFLKTKETNL